MTTDDPTVIPPDDVRPTKALVAELRRQAAADRELADGRLQESEQNYATAKRLRAELDDMDPEAVALASCAAALRRMLDGPTNAASTRQAGMMTPSPSYGPYRLTAASTSVGRILLALGARHGLELVDAPQPEPTVPDGYVVMRVPEHLQHAVGALLGQ